MQEEKGGPALPAVEVLREELLNSFVCKIQAFQQPQQGTGSLEILAPVCKRQAIQSGMRIFAEQVALLCFSVAVINMTKSNFRKKGFYLAYRSFIKRSQGRN